MTNYKKQTGIWLDYKEAYLISFDPDKGSDEPVIRHLRSRIEWGVPKGGSRSKTPWGPQGGINERSFMERRQQEEKAYFERIIEAIDPETDELFIFGPAEAKQGLRHAILSIKHFRTAIAGFETADSMTLNQMVARVRDFFTAKPVV